MLRRDACRNLSKIGAISALSSSLPFLFAQLKRSKRISIDLPSEQLFAQQNNLSCEEISQIAVWCSLGDVVSKKALLQDDFFSSIGLALQVLKAYLLLVSNIQFLGRQRIRMRHCLSARTIRQPLYRAA
jgi:hypothetical protein